MGRRCSRRPAGPRPSPPRSGRGRCTGRAAQCAVVAATPSPDAASSIAARDRVRSLGFTAPQRGQEHEGRRARKRFPVAAATIASLSAIERGGAAKSPSTRWARPARRDGPAARVERADVAAELDLPGCRSRASHRQSHNTRCWRRWPSSPPQSPSSTGMLLAQRRSRPAAGTTRPRPARRWSAAPGRRGSGRSDAEDPGAGERPGPRGRSRSTSTCRLLARERPARLTPRPRRSGRSHARGRVERLEPLRPPSAAARGHRRCPDPRRSATCPRSRSTRAPANLVERPGLRGREQPPGPCRTRRPAGWPAPRPGRGRRAAPDRRSAPPNAPGTPPPRPARRGPAPARPTARARRRPPRRARARPGPGARPGDPDRRRVGHLAPGPRAASAGRSSERRR